GPRDLHSFPTRRSSDLKPNRSRRENKNRTNDVSWKKARLDAIIGKDHCENALFGKHVSCILSLDEGYLRGTRRRFNALCTLVRRSEEHTSELQSRENLV